MLNVTIADGNFAQFSRHDVLQKYREKRIAEMKLSRKPGVTRGSEIKKAPSSAQPPDKKKAAIVARMKALQSQILGDFKKVTGFGKQAGYVPPPKIPPM